MIFRCCHYSNTFSPGTVSKLNISCKQLVLFLRDYTYRTLQVADESAALSKPIFSKEKSSMTNLSSVPFPFCIHSFACDKMKSIAPPLPKFGLAQALARLHTASLAMGMGMDKSQSLDFARKI